MADTFIGLIKVATTLFLLITFGFFVYVAGKKFQEKDDMAGDLITAFFMMSAIWFMWR